jgi:hypothetical protein
MRDPQNLTTLWASTTCYENVCNFLYVDDVRTLQETLIMASAAGYGHSFTILYVMIFVPDRKQTYGSYGLLLG